MFFLCAARGIEIRLRAGTSFVTALAGDAPRHLPQRGRLHKVAAGGGLRYAGGRGGLLKKKLQVDAEQSLPLEGKVASGVSRKPDDG